MEPSCREAMTSYLNVLVYQNSVLSCNCHSSIITEEHGCPHDLNSQFTLVLNGHKSILILK